MMFVRSKPKLTPTETRLVEQTELLTKESIGKINAFFASQWADFRKAVEGITLKQFKDYEAIK